MWKEKKIGKCVVSGRREEAEYCVRRLNLDVEDLVSGATYVWIDAAMRYIKNQSSFTLLLNVQILGGNDVTQTHTKQCRPIWTIHLYPCQNMNSYGARFPAIPTLKIHNVAEENETNFDTT